jgi:hypothetical protein
MQSLAGDSCQLEAENSRPKVKVMRRDFQTYLFFLNCIAHSRRQNTAHRSKDEKEEQCYDVRPGRLEQRCRIAAGYALLSGIKRARKRRHHSSEFEITVTMN